MYLWESGRSDLGMELYVYGTSRFGGIYTALHSAVYAGESSPPRYAMAAMIAGPIFTLVGKFILPATIDSLFLGIAATIVITAAGIIKRK